ncbi:hypothetical protein [Streptomyces sp. NPDC047061]|uniref:hypothetical protein n=1 Tax=Streptomyces sp. NPDC047061 TaxID=3154605 RepID=UPI00340C13D4
MKNCRRFAYIKSGFEQEIRRLSSHVKRSRGSASVRTSARNAVVVKRNMAGALNQHLDRCHECG